MPTVPRQEREEYRQWAKNNAKAQMDEMAWVHESDYADFAIREPVYYMTGCTTCRNMDNALDNVARFRKPAVIRQEGRFYIVTRLATKPVQPGQFAFKIKEGEKIFNI